MTSDSPLHAAALAYTKLGWAVHPLKPSSKEPASERGFHDASMDPEQIAAWWGQQPGYNIGIATGEPSDIVVVDVDDVQELRRLEQQTYVGQTTTCDTGRGLHLYFQRPDDGLRNSAGRLAPGIDVRGDGGYVVVPPSVHPDGHRYQWASQQGVRPAVFPQQWLDQLKVDPRPAPQPPALPPPGGGEPAAGWGAGALRNKLAELAAAQPGTRNDRLLSTAVALFGVAKGGHLDERDVGQRLRATAQAIGLESSEIERALSHGYSYAEPLHPTDPPSATPTSVARPTLPATSVPVDTGRRSRLITLDALAEIPPPTWLIPSMLPEGLNMLFGAYGSGKTFAALDWALTVASGGAGQSPRSVIYCAGEGASGLRDRITAWRQWHPNLDPDGRLSVLTFGAFPRLLDDSSVAELCADIEQLEEPPALLIVDTLARSLAGGEENKPADVGRVIAVLDDLRGRYGMSALVVHHSGWDRSKERGHSSLGGACDSVWRMDAPDEAAIGFNVLHKLKCTKMKEAPRPSTRELAMSNVGPSCVLTPSTPHQFQPPPGTTGTGVSHAF